ncbi:hypothetical protein Y695_04898 [Hydrogenophaga sp. T4]|nr:hypothetical protein Y695_04898 [Hydrogenophaga sp. T4]
MTAAFQTFRFSRAASAMAAFTCRFASAVAWPRIEPATLFAVLSHMLMNGFFFSQGLDMVRFRCLTGKDSASAGSSGGPCPVQGVCFLR